MVVTIVPDRMRVMLKAGAARFVVCPSADRLFCHHCGSLEVSMAAKAPTTRNTARSSESDIGVSRTAVEGHVGGQGECDPREDRTGERVDRRVDEAELEQLGDRARRRTTWSAVPGRAVNRGILFRSPAAAAPRSLYGRRCAVDG